MSARSEFEREFFEGGSWTPPGGWQLDRRDFLKIFGGGLFVGLANAAALAQEAGRSFGEHALPKDLSAWLHIAADGAVRVFTGKVEVGQNIRTSLAQQVAEELRVAFDSIEMVMGDTALVPYDMGTFGSRTTPTMGPQLRTMAAAARQMLLETAATRWNADAATLVAADGKVCDPENAADAQLWRADARREPGEDRLERRSADAGERVEDCRNAGSQGAGPRLRHREACLSLGCCAAGHVVWRGAAARWLQCEAAIDRHERGGETARSDRWCATAILPAWLRPIRLLRSMRFDAIQAKWDVPAQPSNRELFEVLKNGSGNGIRESDRSMLRAPWRRRWTRRM